MNTNATMVSRANDPPPPTPPAHLQENPRDNPYALPPPGWTTVVHEADGRVYYWEMNTGKTSWSHPLANRNQHVRPPPPPPATSMGPPTSRGMSSRSMQQNSASAPPMVVPGIPYHNMASPYGGGGGGIHNPLVESPINAARRPDAQQCYAVTALLLFPLLGIFALYHSISVNRAWQEGRYSDAFSHSREAPKYAGISCFLGVIFWCWYLFFRREAEMEWEWPDWEIFKND